MFFAVRLCARTKQVLLIVKSPVNAPLGPHDWCGLGEGEVLNLALSTTTGCVDFVQTLSVTVVCLLHDGFALQVIREEAGKKFLQNRIKPSRTSSMHWQTG